jgi:macrophage erythroblast attacher
MVRATHLEDASKRPSTDESDASGSVDSGIDVEIERLVVDFLLRVGSLATLQAAKSIYTRTGRQALLDTPVYAITLKICPSLLRRDATLALAWCDENRDWVESSGSSLALRLRIAQFVEFLKLNQVCMIMNL